MSRQSTNFVRTFGTSVVAIAGNFSTDANGDVIGTSPPDGFSFTVTVFDQPERVYSVSFPDDYGEHLCVLTNSPIFDVHATVESYDLGTGDFTLRMASFAGGVVPGPLRADFVAFMRNSSVKF